MDHQSRKRVYCPHCDDYIARSLYYQHKHLYYDEIRRSWLPNVRESAEQLQLDEDIVSYEFSPSRSPVHVGYISESEGNT